MRAKGRRNFQRARNSFPPHIYGSRVCGKISHLWKHLQIMNHVEVIVSSFLLLVVLLFNSTILYLYKRRNEHPYRARPLRITTFLQLGCAIGLILTILRRIGPGFFGCVVETFGIQMLWIFGLLGEIFRQTYIYHQFILSTEIVQYYKNSALEYFRIPEVLEIC